MTPVNLSITEDNQLEIRWDDGVVQRIAVGQLRDACPCANCRARREAGADVVERDSPGSTTEPAAATGFQLPVVSGRMLIEKMAPVGNYAYNIRFSDGHHTGIFSFEFLRKFPGTD